MATSQNFRSAFNGFNREDVVQYLEYLNTKHTSLVNQLSEEADNLRQKLSVAAEAIAADSSRGEKIHALEAECAELKAQLSQAQAAAEASDAARRALEAECASLRAQLAAAQAAPAVSTLDPSREQQLIAQYSALQTALEASQAENVRLNQQLQEAKAAPAQALSTEKELEAYRRAERTERMARERAELLYRQTNGVLADATVKVDQVAAEIGSIADNVMQQLQQLQSAVTGSKEALHEASTLMYAIRPEEETL